MDKENLFVGKIGNVGVWHKRMSEDENDLREWVIAGAFGYDELIEALAVVVDESDIKIWIKELMGALVAPVVVWCLDGDVVWCGSKGASVWVVREGVHAKLGHEITKVSTDVISGWARRGDDYLGLWGDVADLHLLSTQEQFMAIVESRAVIDAIAGVMIRRLSELGCETLLDTGKSVEEFEEDEEIEVEKEKTLGWGWRGLKKFVSVLPRRDDVLAWHDERRDKMESKIGKLMMRGLAGVLVIVLIMVGTKGAFDSRASLRQADLDAIVTQIRSKIDEGVGLGTINPTRSKAVFDEAVVLLGKLEAQKGAEDLVSGLRRQIESSLGQATGEYKTEPVVWQTLALIRDGIEASDWYYDGEKLWLVDRVGQRLIAINGNTKAYEVVLGADDMVGIGQVAVSENEDVWLVGNKVIVKDIKGDKKELVWDSGENGSLVAIGVFGENGYGASERGIWRFRVEGDSVVSSRWLGESALENWVVPSAMAIDGSIWTGGGGSMVKYQSGRRENFVMNNLSEPILEIKDIFTNDKSKNVYVFDSNLGRVVVVNKETKDVVGQYKSDVLGQVIRIAADEETGVMWWLTPETIYQVRL